MLPQRQKLRRSTFPLHTDSKTNWIGGVLRIQLHIPKVTPLPQSLYAVVVAKRFAKLAVERNKFRRMVFANIETNNEAFGRFSAGKYVITPTKAVALILDSEITSDIARFLAR